MAEAMTSLPIPGAAQYLYINPDRSDWPALPATTALAGIGIDAYHSPAIAIARLPEVHKRYGLPVHVWVRSFSLTRRQTLRPANDLSLLLNAGVSDIGIWGYPSAGCSCLDNADPQRVWNGITATIARLVRSPGGLTIRPKAGRFAYPGPRRRHRLRPGSGPFGSM